MKDFFTQYNLQTFYTSYIQIVQFKLDYFGITQELVGDHLGISLNSTTLFEEVSEQLLNLGTMIKEVELHGRRVRIYKLNNSLNGIYSLNKVEIFEPKPDEEFKNFRNGIEHIAFFVPNYDDFIKTHKKNLLVAKEGVVNNSKFLKTQIFNTVEIEFRSDKLGEEND